MYTFIVQWSIDCRTKYYFISWLCFWKKKILFNSYASDMLDLFTFCPHPQLCIENNMNYNIMENEYYNWHLKTKYTKILLHALHREQYMNSSKCVLVSFRGPHISHRCSSELITVKGWNQGKYGKGHVLFFLWYKSNDLQCQQMTPPKVPWQERHDAVCKIYIIMKSMIKIYNTCSMGRKIIQTSGKEEIIQKHNIYKYLVVNEPLLTGI